MKWLSFTNYYNHAVWVNMDNATLMVPEKKTLTLDDGTNRPAVVEGTQIYLVGDSEPIWVQESPNQIVSCL